MGDLFHYLPRKVIEVPSSVPYSTFSVLRRRRNICSITTCSIAQGTTESGAVGEGWGVRSEDDFLGSCKLSHCLPIYPPLKNRKWKFRLMVSHVTIRNRTLLTHMKNAEEVVGCIIKNVLMTSLYCSWVSTGACWGQVRKSCLLIHIHITVFIKMMRCLLFEDTQSTHSALL